MNIKRRYKIYILLIGTLTLLLIGDYLYGKSTGRMTIRRPIVTIKYNGEILNTKSGDENWFNLKSGGNSMLRGNPYEIGQSMKAFNAKPGEKIEVIFSLKPKEIYFVNWEDKPRMDCAEKIFGSSEKYLIDLPSNKGEYIFEVYGHWDQSHTSSNIIKVRIE